MGLRTRVANWLWPELRPRVEAAIEATTDELDGAILTLDITVEDLQNLVDVTEDRVDSLEDNQ